jgi:SagB-type dehydrogenase family enzyme
MRLLILAALPLVAIAAWAAWRAVRGRPVRRFALNAVVASTLVVYFAITAGLGIFWVANQELPVFDPHYLFGYLTLALVVSHVWINAPLLARFVRTRSRALSAEGQAFRPSVRWAGRVLGLAAFGGFWFWVGFSRGASTIVVESGAPAPAGGGEQMVTEDGEKKPLSRWYHERSALSRTAAVARGPALDWAARPAPFETYPAEAVVPLGDRAPVDRATAKALDESREGAAGLAPHPVALPALSALLHLTQGITEVTGLPTDPFHKRAAASSGALYPTVTHVVVRDVDGLVPGLYHYEPQHHALHRLRSADAAGELAAIVAHGAAVRAAPFTLVLSAIYYKSSWKYGERGYRYCLLDAGHVAANAIAAGRALGLATRPIGRFDDARLGALLGIDRHHQGALLVLPFGAGAAVAAAPAHEPAFVPDDLALAGDHLPVPVRVIASRTGLRLANDAVPAPDVPAAPLAPRATGETIALPPPASTDDALAAVVARRRSQRRFGDRPITAGELAAILRRAPGPSIEDQRAIRIHVVALRVDGLAPGAYEYHPEPSPGLVAVRTGDLADTIHSAALSQEVAARAAAILVVSADAAALAARDGTRGFRYAWLDAGVAGGRIYLQAVALGLGVSSIGAFFDDDLVELLRLERGRDLPALLVAIGRS